MVQFVGLTTPTTELPKSVCIALKVGIHNRKVLQHSSIPRGTPGTPRMWSGTRCLNVASHKASVNFRGPPPHHMTPNPSIEGTCNIRLRLLSHAPHVKR